MSDGRTYNSNNYSRGDRRYRGHPHSSNYRGESYGGKGSGFRRQWNDDESYPSTSDGMDTNDNGERYTSNYNQSHRHYNRGRGNYSSDYPSSSSNGSYSNYSYPNQCPSSANSENASQYAYHQNSNSHSRNKGYNYSSNNHYQDPHSHNIYRHYNKHDSEEVASYNEENDPNASHTPLKVPSSSSTKATNIPAANLTSTHIKFETPCPSASPAPSSPPPLIIPPTPINFNKIPSTPVISAMASHSTTPQFTHCTPLPAASATPCAQNRSSSCGIPCTFNPPPPLQQEHESSTSGQDSVSVLNILLQKLGYPPPTFTYDVLNGIPVKFFATVSSGAKSITTPQPCKSKKEAKKFAAELWMNAYKALEASPHKRKDIMYLPEPASPAPTDPTHAATQANESTPKDGWISNLNVWIQKNHLQFPEIQILQNHRGYAAKIKSSIIDLKDSTYHKTRKEARESIAKLAYEHLVKKYPVKLGGTNNQTKPSNLPASSLYAVPFYSENFGSNLIAPSVENAMDVDTDGSKHMEEDNNYLNPSSTIAFLQSVATTDILKEFCRRAGLELQIQRTTVCDPTIFDITLGAFHEIDAEEEIACRRLLAQIADYLAEATGLEKDEQGIVG